MRLLTLKLQARGVNGWESPSLEFGRRLTSLFAPNGSGKTPIVQAVAFSLGFDTKFRDDIREKCEAVVLTVQHRAIELTIRRAIATDFHATICAGDRRREFFSEGDFSRVLFEELGMTVPALVGTNRQLTRPYVSTVLPLFYVRQDGGYNEPYRAPATFIASQFVEMVRFAFGLSPRHSYNARRELLQAREQLEALQRRVVSQQKVVLDLSAESDDSSEAYELLVGQTAELTSRLDELKESVDAQGAANDALAELLQAKEEQIRKARREQGDLRARIAGIESIRAEIARDLRIAESTARRMARVYSADVTPNRHTSVHAMVEKWRQTIASAGSIGIASRAEPGLWKALRRYAPEELGGVSTADRGL